MSGENNHDATAKILEESESGWSSGGFPEINFWKEGDPVVEVDEKETVEESPMAQDDEEQTATDEQIAYSMTQEEAESLVDDAVEFYFSDDYRTAVHIFSQALEVLTQTYDQQDLGEIWYYYGDSLLMLAKQRASFINESDFNAGDATVDLSNDEEMEEPEGEDEVKEEKKEIQEVKEEKQEIKSDLGPEEQKQLDAERDIEVAEELELAWQILELARIALSQDDSKKKELSNVHLSLANVAIESENLPGAIEEFNACIKLRSENFGPMNRQVAEAEYLKGLALAGSQDHIEQAAKSLKAAKEIIEKNISDLKAENKEEEAKELEEILTELIEQIEGISGEQVAPETIREIVNSSLKAASQSGFEFAAPTTEETQVNDLTGQIKRSGIKRKATSDNDQNRVLKKARSESEEN